MSGLGLSAHSRHKHPVCITASYEKLMCLPLHAIQAYWALQLRSSTCTHAYMHGSTRSEQQLYTGTAGPNSDRTWSSPDSIRSICCRWSYSAACVLPWISLVCSSTCNRINCQHHGQWQASVAVLAFVATNLQCSLGCCSGVFVSCHCLLHQLVIGELFLLLGRLLLLLVGVCPSKQLLPLHIAPCVGADCAIGHTLAANCLGGPSCSKARPVVLHLSALWCSVLKRCGVALDAFWTIKAYTSIPLLHYMSVASKNLAVEEPFQIHNCTAQCVQV